MKSLYAYIRVSTTKQGEHGVSLQEQRAAIERYALQRGVGIAEWFEEVQTAAKRGRPVFSRMLRLLQRGNAQGVVIHKIDRSARNLRDWADLGELIDRGVQVHFAAESLDLHSRGGRLSADIQAVVAADFIRNLREETRKGFYGRLRQGLYPLAGPLGYLDQGRGKPKIPDPERAPLVKMAFQLYARRDLSLHQLVVEMRARGLSNRRGGHVSLNGMSRLLNNLFYTGVIRLRSGETFAGIHEPLIPKRLFDHVQDILRGKTNTKAFVHDFKYRRSLTCASCRQTLIGERQKGHNYYRCHTPGCETKTIREEVVESSVISTLSRLWLQPTELALLQQTAEEFLATQVHDRAGLRESLELRLGNIKARVARLTDALIDDAIGRDSFEERRTVLIRERADIERQLADLTGTQVANAGRLREYLELLSKTQLQHEFADPAEKRDLLSELTSNRTVFRKNVVVELQEPFHSVAGCLETQRCDPHRDIPRTFQAVVSRIDAWIVAEEAEKRKQAALALEKEWKEAA
jgi:site-specific DNA recombinase